MMRETPLSISEKKFILDCIGKKLRVDGRKLDEFRNININYGSEWGSAFVSMGETKIMAQVSCELGQPTTTRLNEGILYINVEIGQMAAEHFESGRNSNLAVKTTRILERTFKDSRAVDLESLCVTADDKVWILRVDLNVLNHDGNIVDCASIAALSALAHFKRPDVSIENDEVKIHTAAEKDFIPIVLHHYPVCISYATFEKGTADVADPTYIEERVSDAIIVFGLNSYREICCLNFGGTSLSSPKLLLKCAYRASDRAKQLVEIVKNKLNEDSEARIAGKAIGFSECLKLNKLTSMAEDRLPIRLRNFSFANTFNQTSSLMETDACKVEDIKDGQTTLSSNQETIKWLPDSESEADDTMYEDSHLENKNQTKELETLKLDSENKKLASKKVKSAKKERLDSDSEEDEVVILN